MALEERVRAIREEAVRAGREPVPNQFQGVAKARVKRVLTMIDRSSPDIVDAVYALLDDQTPSWFPSGASNGLRFCDGASTAHIACHVGILQRDGRKLDREGRDYWIKPLREVGAIEPVMLLKETGAFIAGHPIAKSSNSGYRLAADFVEVLMAPEEVLAERVSQWIAADSVRQRLEMQAEAAQQALLGVDTKHSDLIRAAVDKYAPGFLPGYQVLYVDDGDGDRIPAEAKVRLKRAGIAIELCDAMPDVLLWNSTTGSFWVIEAVTSDGEVDFHKVVQVTALIERSQREAQIGFTTVYRTWRDVATRQGRFKNLAPDTCLWILEDPSREFVVKALPETSGHVHLTFIPKKS